LVLGFARGRTRRVEYRFLAFACSVCFRLFPFVSHFTVAFVVPWRLCRESQGPRGFDINNLDKAKKTETQRKQTVKAFAQKHFLRQPLMHSDLIADSPWRSATSARSFPVPS
jgi:hypothetical protein